jgi:hypothetical protein
MQRKDKKVIFAKRKMYFIIESRDHTSDLCECTNNMEKGVSQWNSS